MCSSTETLHQFVRIFFEHNCFNRFKWLTNTVITRNISPLNSIETRYGQKKELERRKDVLKRPSTISSHSIRVFSFQANQTRSKITLGAFQDAHTDFTFSRRRKKKHKLNGEFIFDFLFSVWSSHGGAKTFHTNKNANLYVCFCRCCCHSRHFSRCLDCAYRAEKIYIKIWYLIVFDVFVSFDKW